jgi:hypothetical protein
MPKRKVRQGESIPSIAAQSGFFSDTIWNHPQNSSLKQLREDMNVLSPGDEVFIPEKELKDESGATEQKHSFKKKGEPHKLKLKLLAMGKPRANEDYVLEVGGQLFDGKTDAEGKIEKTIPGNARSGTLILRGGKEKHTVKIGNLDPLDETSGVQQRLNNLGFSCGSESGKMNEATGQALKKFQIKHNLEVTGQIDDATKAKLKEFYP